MALRFAVMLLLLPLTFLACGRIGGARDSSAAADESPSDPSDDLAGSDATVPPVDDGSDHIDITPDSGPDSASGSGDFPPHVRLLHPSSRPLLGVPAARVVLGGLLSGRADSMNWEGAGTSGTMEPLPWWTSGPIDLVPGDNLLTVVARRGEHLSSDSIRITYTPGFDCPTPVAWPDVAFVGDSVTVVIRFPLGQDAPVDAARLAIYRVGPDFQPSGDADFVTRPRDDGLVAKHGDEIAGDGIYSARVPLTCTVDGPLRFRVQVPVVVGDATYLALSPPAEVDCMPRVRASECRDAQDAVNAARVRFDASRSSGEEAARLAARDLLEARPGVAESGLGPGYGAWVRMASGLLGVVSLAPEDLRAGPASRPAARRAALLDAATASPSGRDEITAFDEALLDNDCPRWVRSGPFHGVEVGPDRIVHSLDAGVLALAAHGDLFFTGLSIEARTAFGWSHEAPVSALDLGEPLDCGALLAAPASCSRRVPCPGGAECAFTGASETDLEGTCVDHLQADLRRGRLAVAPRGVAMLPGFLDRHARRALPDALVFLGACRSLDGGVLAAAFLAAGARTVIGWSGYPTDTGAVKAGSDILGRIAAGTPAGQAVAAVPPDPGSLGARLVLVGDESLALGGTDLMDGGFERGDLTPWQVDGDGRAIARLGVTEPVSGKFMAILSTGLGYTVDAGVVRQPLCLPAGTRTLSFWWQFYSAEFREFCGSNYQDSFVARLVNDSAVEVPLVRRAIDDLCDPADCPSCCVAGLCRGLVDSEVELGQAGVFRLPAWQKVEADVSAFAGRGPVDLVLEVRDRGDSAFDTAVLVDSIEIR